MTISPNPDGRHRPRFKPPQRIGKRPVTIYLGPADYRLLYEQALTMNTSLQEVVRALIRAVDVSGPSDPDIKALCRQQEASDK